MDESTCQEMANGESLCNDMAVKTPLLMLTLVFSQFWSFRLLVHILT